jgi:thiamine biosynthesis lipoprotein
MGTSWSVQLVPGPSGPTDDAGIRAVLDRVIAQMSNWEADSDLSRFNRAAPGQWRTLPPEFSHVLAAALAISDASAGAFDPAAGALVDLWGFGPAGPRDAPDDAAVADARARSGRTAIEHVPTLLSARRVRAAALDFSGIAKGHAVDAVAAYLRGQGCADFLVEIGGELLGHGIKPDGQPWWVAFESVPGADLPPIRAALHGLAIATSGDYRRFVERAGARHAHTIDPRTGRPIANGVASVTVLHAECMHADAWATALTVLGPVEGLAIAVREGLAMQMVVREGEGFRELLSPALAEMLA